MSQDFDDTKFDLKEIGRRAIKYLIEGLMVAIAAYFIPKKGKNGQSLLSANCSETITLGSNSDDVLKFY